jgi:hypothetical protein
LRRWLEAVGQKPLTLALSRRERGDRSVCSRYAGLKYPVELMFEHSKRSAPFPLYPLGERAGVRGIDLEHTAD